MSSIESPRFPDNIAIGAEGGQEWLTQIVAQISGFEQRNVAWPIPRRRYNVTLLNRDIEEIREVASFMMITQGRANSFRFKDFIDFEVPDTSGGTGLLGTGVGTGEPTYQLVKRYLSGSANHDRDITKPISTIAVERAGYPAVAGGSPLNAGQIAVDYTTGIVTFGADASASVLQIVPGTTTQIVVSALLSPLLAGGKIWLDGIGGTVGAFLNDAAWTINSVQSGQTYVIAANTSGLATGSPTEGFARAYPQPAETLTWIGEFDVHVRFDIDRMRAVVTVGGESESRRATWDSIELVEVRG